MEEFATKEVEELLASKGYMVYGNGDRHGWYEWTWTRQLQNCTRWLTVSIDFLDHEIILNINHSSNLEGRVCHHRRYCNKWVNVPIDIVRYDIIQIFNKRA